MTCSPLPPVSLVRCPDYDPAGVAAALQHLLEPLGGMERYIRPGQRVLLKPNLLSPVPPEKAVTTHPAVVEAVVRMVRACGGRPVLADSCPPSVPYTPSGLARLYRRTGMAEVAARTGLELNTDTEAVDRPCPSVCLRRRFEVMRPLVEADVVISLPKLKTHNLTVLTGAVKNMFGVIPGARKPAFHVALPRLDDFADMLLDIALFANPALVIMDAVVGMDGEGPSAGRPFPIGLLLASTSSLALDVIAAEVVDVPPQHVPTLRRAMERGLWSGRVADVEVCGLALAEARVSGFRRPERNPPLVERMIGPGPAAFVRRLAVRYAMRRPLPRAGRCTACRACEQTCPVGAIAVHDGLARVDDRLCIRCYCCHEVCPEKAIDLVTPWPARVLAKVR